jgi:lipoprotein-anchoring transpeptidase ErfK/SrfK
MLVRPSTWGLLALSLASACIALLAFPSARPAAAPTLPHGTAFVHTRGDPLAIERVGRARIALAAATTPARPSPTAAPRRFQVVRIRTGQSLALRSAPGGAAVARIGARTEFGSKRVLAVAAVRGRWLGVTATERPNGKLAWVDSRSGAVDLGRTRVSLHADLSSRRIELRIGRLTVARMSVAVGRPESPTPTGRFAVTDKLPGGRYAGYFGCCILALSGHQPNTPPGWTGGNRLAIHGTNAPGTIGDAVSAGCLRGSESDMKLLMRRVPVGTPVFIRR